LTFKEWLDNITKNNTKNNIVYFYIPD
jgi:hypothetical protein